MDLLVIERLSNTAILPTKAHIGDLGYDLYIAEPILISCSDTVVLPTHIRVNFPVGWGGLIRDRSSVATKKKCFVVAGVIDCDYSGEIKVAMYNSSIYDVQFEGGEKIAQLLPIKVVDWQIQEVSKVIEKGTRKNNGFGSSGV